MAGKTLTVYLAADTSRFRSGMRSAGDDIDGPTGFRGRMSNLTDFLRANAGPAFLGVAGLAGGLAIKLGVDGVQAAADQQEALGKLDGVLDKMGFGDQKDEARDFIDQLARVTTFGDDELVGPLQDLTTAIGGEDGLNKAMAYLPGLLDASVSTGKPLPGIVNAMAKAANGNETALSRMFPWLDKTTLKTGDLDLITGLLADRFAGSAAKAADTWKGKLNLARDAFGELQESFGEGFLGGLDAAEGKAGDLTDKLYDMQPAAEELGSDVADMLTTIGDLVTAYSDLKDNIDDFRKAIEGTEWARIFKILEDSMLGPLKVGKDLLSTLLSIRTIDQTAQYAGGNATNVPGYIGQRPETSSQVPSTRALVTEQQVGQAIINIIGKTDARSGYVVGGVLR